MPTTITSGISWDEYFEGWSEHWAYDEVSATRIADVDWEDADPFLLDMLGTHAVFNGQIQRVLPEVHPDFPWMRVVECNLIATLGEVGIEGSNGPITYEKARYQVRYAALPYDVTSDANVPSSPGGELARYVERLHTYAAENVTLPGGSFKFVDTGTPIPEPGVKTFFTKELTYIWHLVPAVPDGAIEDCIGKSNSTIFDSRYAKDTILFLAPDIKRMPSTPQGDVLYRISYKFLWREAGWNSLFRKTPSPNFYPIIGSDGTTMLYSQTDLNALFSMSEGFEGESGGGDF